jgi:hypothetical protein
MHESITQERVCETVELCLSSLENLGFCHNCGEEADGCEPDARNYKCEVCGAHEVFGAEETLFMV